MTIRSVTQGDAEKIAALYNHYVINTIITFEEDRVSANEMATRIRSVTASHPWIVFEEAGALTGYAYAVNWHSRPAYRHSVETTIYVAPDQYRKGIGRALYDALLAELRDRGFHSAIGGVSLPNDASAALHERLGFEKVAHLKEVGQKFGAWVDVGYWQLLL